MRIFYTLFIFFTNKYKDLPESLFKFKREGEIVKKIDITWLQEQFDNKRCADDIAEELKIKSYVIKNKVKQHYLKEYHCCKYCKTEVNLRKQKCFGGKLVIQNICGKCYSIKKGKTNKKLYGNVFFFKTNTFKEKNKKTIQEKYGVSHISQSREIREKVKKTVLKKYKVDNPLKNKEIKEKVKKTNLKKYGVEYSSQSSGYRQKVKKTWRNKSKKEIFKIDKKRKKTNQNKYGVNFGFEKFNNRGYSLISQELFWEIIKILPEKFKNKTYFYQYNQEYKLYNELTKNWYSYDFIIKDLKICIEFNGDIFHANPEKFKENDHPNPYKKELTSREIWEYDDIKNNFVKSKGFSLYLVWENSYKKNKNKIIKELTEVIDNKIEEINK